jgi:signal transduction histidine kinase
MPSVVDPMPTPSRADRMMLLVFGTGAAIGLQLGMLHVLVWGFARALVTFIPSALLFSGATYALWRWLFPRLGGRSLGAQIAIQTVVSLLAFTVLSFLLTEIVVTALGAPSLFGTPTGPEKQITLTPRDRQMGVWLYALLPILPTALLTLIGYHQYWHRVLAMKDRERELTELAATAQLAALRAQINPHFLFNSLNSIAQLIRSDPDKAEACVERLADIFRYILRRAEKEFVPLGEELEMATAYLDIERARFGERLHVETHVDPKSLHQLIPNLILQPLVENAVKHGLSRKLGPGTVRIDAALDDGCLELTVGDDGLGMPRPALGASTIGVGCGTCATASSACTARAPPGDRSAPGGGTRVRSACPSSRSVSPRDG